MLDQRLELIRSMTPICRGFADVGTDHGYLICQLVGEGRAQWGIATDIHQKPLEKARQEAARLNLSAKIQCVLADGLGELSPDGLDAIAIAGMGGETIVHIIDSWKHSKTKGITWLLQPMTKAERLRQWLYLNGYDIADEKCCKAADRLYSVLKVCYTGNITKPTGHMMHIGAIDPTQSEDAKEYCLRELQRITRKAVGMATSGSKEAKLHQDAAAQLTAFLQQKGVKTP